VPFAQRVIDQMIVTFVKSVKYQTVLPVILILIFVITAKKVISCLLITGLVISLQLVIVLKQCRIKEISVSSVGLVID